MKWLVQLFISKHRQAYEEDLAKLGHLQNQSDEAFKSHQALIRQQLDLDAKLRVLSKEAQLVEAFCGSNKCKVPQLDHLSLAENLTNEETNACDASSPKTKVVSAHGSEDDRLLAQLNAEIASIRELQGSLEGKLENTKSEYVSIINNLSDAHSSLKPIESYSDPRPLHKLLWPSTFSTAEDWMPWKQSLSALPKDPNDRISSKSLKDYVEKYKNESDQAVYRTIDVELSNVEQSFNELKLSLRGEQRMHTKMHATYHSIMKKLQDEFDHVFALFCESLRIRYRSADSSKQEEQRCLPTGGDVVAYQDELARIECCKQLCMKKGTQLAFANYQFNCAAHAVSASKQRLSDLESQFEVLGNYYRSLLCKHMFDWPLPFPRQKAAADAEESLSLIDNSVIVPPVPLLEDVEKLGQEAKQAYEKRLRDEYGSRLRGLVDEHKYTWDLLLQDSLDSHAIQNHSSSLNSLPIITLKDSVEHWVVQQATVEQIDPSDHRRWEMYQRYKLQVSRKWDRAADLQQADIELYEFVEAYKQRLEMLSDVQPVKKGEGVVSMRKLTKESVNALMAEEQNIRMKIREMKFELRHFQESYLSAVDRCQELYEKWLKLARLRQDDWLAYLASQEGKVVVEGAENIKWRRDEIDGLWLEADGLAIRVQYESRQNRQLAQAAAKLSHHWNENNRRWLVYGELDSVRRRYQSAISNAAAAADHAALEQLVQEKTAAQEEMYQLQDEYDQHGKLFYYLADHGPMNDEDLRLAKLKELEDLDRATLFKWNLVLQKQKKGHESFQPLPEEMLLGVSVEDTQTDRLSQHQELREVSYDAELRSYVNSVLRKWIYDKGDEWVSGLKSCEAELREHALSMAITDSCDLAEKAWTAIIATGLRALNKDNAVRKKSTSLKRQILMQEAALATVRDARLVFVGQRKVLDRLDLVWTSILKERSRRKHDKCISAARSYLKSDSKADRNAWENVLTPEERAEYNNWAEKHNELYQLQQSEEEHTLKVIDGLLSKGEEKAAYFRKYIKYYNVDMLSVNQEITLRTLGVAREEHRRRFEPFTRRKNFLRLGGMAEERRADALRHYFKDEHATFLRRLPQDMATLWQQHFEHILGPDRIKRQPYKAALEITTSNFKNLVDILKGYSSSPYTCSTKWLVVAKYCNKGLLLLKNQNLKTYLQPYEFLHSETSHRLLDLIICFQYTVAAALIAQPSSSHAPTCSSSHIHWGTSLSWLSEASFYLELASAILYRIDYNGVVFKLIDYLVACLQSVLVRSAAICELLLGEPFDDRSSIKVVKKHFLGLNEQYSVATAHFLHSTSGNIAGIHRVLNLLQGDFKPSEQPFDLNAEVSTFLLLHQK